MKPTIATMRINPKNNGASELGTIFEAAKMK
jgi:hypothetical protein